MDTEISRYKPIPAINQSTESRGNVRKSASTEPLDSSEEYDKSIALSRSTNVRFEVDILPDLKRRVTRLNELSAQNDYLTSVSRTFNHWLLFYY